MLHRYILALLLPWQILAKSVIFDNPLYGAKCQACLDNVATSCNGASNLRDCFCSSEILVSNAAQCQGFVCFKEDPIQTTYVLLDLVSFCCGTPKWIGLDVCSGNGNAITTGSVG